MLSMLMPQRTISYLPRTALTLPNTRLGRSISFSEMTKMPKNIMLKKVQMSKELTPKQHTKKKVARYKNTKVKGRKKKKKKVKRRANQVMAIEAVG